MSNIDEVTSVPVECYGLLPDAVCPEDRYLKDSTKRRYRLAVLQLNESSYRFAALNDHVQDLYVSPEALIDLNRKVYGVEPDWAKYIAHTFRQARMHRADVQALKEAAARMYALLDNIRTESVDDYEDELADVLAEYRELKQSEPQ